MPSHCERETSSFICNDELAFVGLEFCCNLALTQYLNTRPNLDPGLRSWHYDLLFSPILSKLTN